MGNYYLDIETTGLDEVQDKITTIQYVELERGTGKQLGGINYSQRMGVRRRRNATEIHRRFSNFQQI